MVVARVVETSSDLEGIRRALPGCRSTICQLRASNESLLERIRKRELGAGLRWHEERSLELSASLRVDAPADFAVETDDRSVSELAAQIADKVRWS